MVKAMGVEMSHMSVDTVNAICKEYKLSNADINFRVDATREALSSY